MKIVSRNDAREQGLTRYFTGKPCKHGHVAQRDVANATCTECKKCYDRKIYRLNPEIKKEAQKKRYWINPEKQRQWHREYCAINRDKKLKIKEDWRKRNPDHVRRKAVQYEGNRRARLMSMENRFSDSDVKDLMSLQGERCANCGKSLSRAKYEIDHIVPISRGGGNSRSNIQILCRGCNRKKGNMMPHEWAMVNWRLI